MANATRGATSIMLCDLPPELILEIVQRLDNPTLLHLGLTCHRMQSIAFCTFFSKNDIRDPTAGWLAALQKPIETLSVLRRALFIQRMNAIHYYFNPGVERMIEEVRDMRAFISRVPVIGVVRLLFSTVDNHFNHFNRSGELQALNPNVWKNEFQGLLEVALNKGCYELIVEGGEQLIKLYQEPEDHPQKVITRKKGKRRKKSLKGAKLKSLVKPQEVIHSPTPVLNIKATKIEINSKMLFQNPFFEWTVAMINAGASTINTLSFRIHGLPPIFWKRLLGGITLPKLRHFDILSDAFRSPPVGVCFADVHSFLGRHPNITNLFLCQLELPAGVWPPPSLDIPILPQLQKITAHPFYLIWILSGLLLDKEAYPNLCGITISSEYCMNAFDFDYALFDDALEGVATFPGNIHLTLLFGHPSPTNDWFEKHLSTIDDDSQSSVISRLDNVTSLSLSSSWCIDWMTVAVLPAWLAMFPNLTVIRFRDQLYETKIGKLMKKQAVKDVAKACPRVKLLDVETQIIPLDEVRKEFLVGVDSEGGQESGRGVSA